MIVCAVPGCTERPERTRGLCSHHRNIVRKSPMLTTQQREHRGLVAILRRRHIAGTLEPATPHEIADAMLGDGDLTRGHWDEEDT